MSDPVGFFITFRTHGTWLPGDAQGTADRGQSTFGVPHAPRDDMLRQYATRLMAQRPLTLTVPMREAVNDAILRVCADRAWRVAALNVRSNHVHVVASAPATPEFVLNRLKSSSTATLRAQGLVAADQRIWSRHGSTRYLWDDDQVAAACDYTLNRQD